MHGPGARGVKQVSPPTMPMSESHLFALPSLAHGPHRETAMFPNVGGTAHFQHFEIEMQ